MWATLFWGGVSPLPLYPVPLFTLSGWLEDQPAVITDRTEIRPAAELGPIILCLDTSGSMSVRVDLSATRGGRMIVGV